jgi:hypothetical protein
MNLKVIIKYLPGTSTAIDESLRGAAYAVLNSNGTLHALTSPADAFLKSLLPNNLQIHTTLATLTKIPACPVLLLGGANAELKAAQALEPDPLKLLLVKGTQGAGVKSSSGVFLDQGLTPGPGGTMPYMITIQMALEKFEKPDPLKLWKLIHPNTPPPASLTQKPGPPLDPFDL